MKRLHKSYTEKHRIINEIVYHITTFMKAGTREIEKMIGDSKAQMNGLLGINRALSIAVMTAELKWEKKTEVETKETVNS